ncbi:ABC transporter substrate-binding protein, partial [Candidatus Bipolaricaulota bacterium]|nr:ABC transporter substrate-binding protein [Candidatus Bipolaricaulota bacterium]
ARFEKYGLIQEVIVQLAPDVFLFELLEKHAYQADYVSWPQPSNPNAVMGYNYDFRFIEVFPDRIP